MRRASVIIVGVMVSLAGLVFVWTVVPETEGTCTVIEPACFCVTDENGEERCSGCQSVEACETNRILGGFAGMLTFAMMLCATLWIAERVSDRR